MYFPFLVNKQSENLSIRTLSDKKKLGNVIPLINTHFVDPNTDWTDVDSINKFIDKKFKSLISTLYSNKNRFIIVINDTLIKNSISIESIYKKFVSYTDEDIKDYCIFGIYDSELSKTKEIFFENKQYAILFDKKIIETEEKATFNILLEERLLLDFINSKLDNKVIITDAFIKKETNREYDNDDLFTNCIFNYSNTGFIGFGDYTILSKKFTSMDGGNMNTITVASHLTYKKDNTLYIKHYTCTPEDEPSNVERVKNVLKQIKDNYGMFCPTHGLDTLITLEGTSLGKMKELSISHHIEKINILLK